MEISSREILLADMRVATFRPVISDDESFLLRVYGSTRLEELALTGWDDTQRNAFVKMQLEAQQSHYRQYYPQAEHLIILVDGTPVGRLYVTVQNEEIMILDIIILPEHRKTGIGTPILTELKSESELAGKPLRIYVESFNPSLRLFERLGFVKTEESGYNYLMEWRTV